MAALLSGRPRTSWTEDGSQLAWKNLGTPGGAAAALLGLLPTKLRAAKTPTDPLPRTTKPVFFLLRVCVYVGAVMAVFVDSGFWSRHPFCSVIHLLSDSFIWVPLRFALPLWISARSGKNPHSFQQSVHTSALQ